jgi:hypothetical protein
MPLFYRDGIHRAIGSKLKQKRFFNCTVAALPTEPPMEQKYKYGTELCRDILFKNCKTIYETVNSRIAGFDIL